MLLQEEIDRSFGTGPEHPPVEHRIAAGRRVLRRRRAAAALAAVGVVAALGTTYAVATVGPEGNGHAEVAVDPTPSPTGTAEPLVEPWEDNTPVRYLEGGLQVRPGVVVHRHIENPFGYQPPLQSDALDLTFEGQRMWVLAELTDNGFGWQSTAPSNGWAGFDDWVADQVGATGSGWPQTLRLTDEGEVVASRDSEILQRTDDPRLGDSFAPPGTPTGAALVQAAEDDVVYFVVWRVLDGELDAIPVPPRDVVGATFQELVSFARSQYASGEGLR